MVELVTAALKDLYDETFEESGEAARDAATATPTQVATSPSEGDSEEEEAEGGEEEGNIQRKVRVWWEGLELGAAAEAAKRSLSGTGKPRQAGLVVCASLVDKVPNLAGLTRTCEIFGAASLAMENLQVVTSSEFTSISVTAEGWLPLEEVRLS